MFFDADTHVDENEDTWAHMPKELVPTTIMLEEGQIPPWLTPDPGSSSVHSRFWFMDGQLHSRRERNDQRTGTTVATRELHDVPARLSDMEELHVDTQVIYPTVLLNELTRRTELEVALYQSYNRWLADRCGRSADRLRFVALLPYGSIPDAVAEMRWAKDNGAVGFFKRGVDWDRAASDPYFFPVYEQAQDLDLPMCMHSSLPWAALDPHFSRVRPYYTLGFGGVTVQQGFFALNVDHIPQRFPGMRIGYVEAGCMWLPHLFDTLRIPDREHYLAETNQFVTCEVAEDVPYVVRQAGDDNLFVGTDYTHGDRASVLHAHSAMDARDDIDPKSSTKITSDNARRFYGL